MLKNTLNESVKKALPKGVDYWDFDQTKEQQVESFCIEIQVNPGHRMKKSDT